MRLMGRIWGVDGAQHLIMLTTANRPSRRSNGGEFMAVPPDQSHQILDPAKEWPHAVSPIDTKPYTPELKPVIDYPPPRPTKDNTADIGGMAPRTASHSRTS